MKEMVMAALGDRMAVMAVVVLVIMKVATVLMAGVSQWL